MNKCCTGFYCAIFQTVSSHWNKEQVLWVLPLVQLIWTSCDYRPGKIGSILLTVALDKATGKESALVLSLIAQDI